MEDTSQEQVVVTETRAGRSSRRSAVPKFTATDLRAAEKLARDPERRRWLVEMQEPEGMAPGANSRAHARAFRFAEALKKAGYQVTDAPLGPRGGRRFTLDAYAGPRAGHIYRLQQLHSCFTRSEGPDCRCFEDLTDGQIQRVLGLHRSLRGTWGKIHGTDELAGLVRRHDADSLRTAVELYVSTNHRGRESSSLEEIAAAVQATTA